jgi:deazaflavin-dependent oxidoreductase (nitroreductase family)
MAVGSSASYDQQLIAEFRTRGRVVTGALADSRMLLHHVGARSGLERVTPLVWWPAGESAVAVLASNFGAPRHPAWYHNLLANPTTIAEIRAESSRVHARVAVANERRLLVGRIMAATPSAAAAVRNAQRESPSWCSTSSTDSPPASSRKPGPRTPTFELKDETSSRRHRTHLAA